MTESPLPEESIFAQALGISRTTAHRHWRYARVWLLNELGEDGGPQENARKPAGP